jgi:hypothetical protein
MSDLCAIDVFVQDVPVYIDVVEVGIQGPPGSRVVELGFTAVGLLGPSQLLVEYIVTSPLTMSALLSLAYAKTAPVADAVITIRKIDLTPVGTITYHTGALIGVVDLVYSAWVRGDVIEFVAPATTDVGLQTIAVTLSGVR